MKQEIEQALERGRQDYLRRMIAAGVQMYGVDKMRKIVEEVIELERALARPEK